jgi:hypothetical protein
MKGAAAFASREALKDKQFKFIEKNTRIFIGWKTTLCLGY